MKKLLITGISGFAGGHIVRYLFERKTGCKIIGISRSKPVWDFFPASSQDIKKYLPSPQQTSKIKKKSAL